MSPHPVQCTSRPKEKKKKRKRLYFSKKKLCSLDKKCQQECVICKATVHTDLRSKSCIGSCETTFKIRYNSHNNLSKTSDNATTLLFRNSSVNSKNQMRAAINVKCGYISFKKFLRRKNLKLHLMEEVVMIKEDPDHILNTRVEILNKFRHCNKF